MLIAKTNPKLLSDETLIALTELGNLAYHLEVGTYSLVAYSEAYKLDRVNPNSKFGHALSRLPERYSEIGELLAAEIKDIQAGANVSLRYAMERRSNLRKLGYYQ